MADAYLTAKTCPKCGEAYSSARCKPCLATYMRAWTRANPEKVKASTAKKYARTRVADNLKSKAWRAANVERMAAHWRAFNERNKEMIPEWNRLKRIKHKDRIEATKKRYHAARPGLQNLWDANRRAQEIQATPSWANSFFIAEAYHLAKVREKVCGGKWHVDHRVPLRGKTVCGLHVEHNLQVIPGNENMSKSNRHWPDMP